MRLKFNRVWVLWARVEYRAILKQLSQSSPTLNYGHMFLHCKRKEKGRHMKASVLIFFIYIKNTHAA